MKIAAARDVRSGFAEYLDAAQKTTIVVTRHGRPSAVISGVEGMDWDDIEMGLDEDLWSELEARRRDPRPVPFAAALRRWGLLEK
ncbi:MAG: type II toxin-antitoxin system Phd/YefM family antitoxin [Deltaproteobacteria bacterium]|nr:type II toxin-antitoxin system Phd/YefM family antitoxin [Deltaproteobacteria bacterium]